MEGTNMTLTFKRQPGTRNAEDVYDEKTCIGYIYLNPSDRQWYAYSHRFGRGCPTPGTRPQMVGWLLQEWRDEPPKGAKVYNDGS